MRKPISLIFVALLMVTVFGSVSAKHAAGGKYCSATAHNMFKACRYETAEDYFVKKANCINIIDRVDRTECFGEQREEYRETAQLCRDQKVARKELCAKVGEQRYDPDIDPDNFVDPREIGVTVAVNPYYPLVTGNRWVYEGDGETITVVVTDRTKLIDGVRAVVVNDVVVDEDGFLIEDTDDWFAQDTEGNIWYFGEIVENFEVFEGDDPEEAELVDLDGSFKVGVDHAKAGILFRSVPVVGEVIQQEYALGEAEDIAETISTTATADSPAESCVNTCMQTSEYTPIEPGVFETKYYSPGVGFILEIDGEGNSVELVEFANP